VGTIKCDYCHNNVSWGATVCPSCWAQVTYQKKYSAGHWITMISSIFLAFVALVFDFGWWSLAVFFGVVVIGVYLGAEMEPKVYASFRR